METISADQLRQVLTGEKRTPVINVLDREDYRSRHIPGTENIPFSENDFVQRVETRVSSKSDPLIVYCANKSCPASEKAAEKLEKAGFQNVQDFAAGTEGWREAGYKLETSAPMGS